MLIWDDWVVTNLLRPRSRELLPVCDINQSVAIIDRQNSSAQYWIADQTGNLDTLPPTYFSEVKSNHITVHNRFPGEVKLDGTDTIGVHATT
jgi:hypothetical protein